MKLQTLLSTMHQNDYLLVEKMNINSEAVVVNQCDTNGTEIIEKNGNRIVWVNSTERGLSISRNVAIDNAKEEICLIADDDLIYVDDVEKLIVEEFKKNPEIDILTFQVEGIDREFKRYYEYQRNLNYLTSMKVASVEIAFRLNSLKIKSIKFNEKFGAGSKYKMGEENIFLFDCLKKGLKIKYIPIKIANLYVGNSSWFQGFNEKYFMDLGAAYAEMSNSYSIIFILQFAIRKYKLYKNNITFNQAIKTMLNGRREYLLDIKNSYI